MDTVVVTALGKEGIKRMSPPIAHSKTMDLKRRKGGGLIITLCDKIIFLATCETIFSNNSFFLTLKAMLSYSSMFNK